MILLLAASAFAVPNPSPGLLPVTTEVEAGQGELAVGGTTVWLGELSPTGGSLRAGLAPVDGLWIGLTGGGIFSSGNTAPSGAISLTAAVDLARSDRLATGPVLGVGGALNPGGEALIPAVGWSLSGPLDARGATLGDLTLMGGASVLGAIGLGGLEVGALCFADKPNNLRLAVVTFALSDTPYPIPLPSLGYRHQEERWFLELGYTGLLIWQAELGVRL